MVKDRRCSNFKQLSEFELVRIIGLCEVKFGFGIFPIEMHPRYSKQIESVKNISAGVQNSNQPVLNSPYPCKTQIYLYKTSSY